LAGVFGPFGGGEESDMKKFELTVPAMGAVFFFLLLPVDLVWTPTFFVIKAAVNAVSALVYAVILSALWNRRVEPVEHGGLLFVLGLVTLPYLLFLPVFYYSGLICTAISVGMAAVLLADAWKLRKNKE